MFAIKMYGEAKIGQTQLNKYNQNETFWSVQSHNMTFSHKESATLFWINNGRKI